MILKKLTIYGFKSFAEKTELHFGEGITAIVGPNGCGKSNVVDAIRWVFGEQKTSNLRSNSMQDVIFSGSEKRQPLNLGEVTLTIGNNKGLLPLEYSEVAITRRIYRSGESEYLINRTQCRLKDITSLFLDTGIGTNVYTTIENSMINKILSDKAEERRILFEEAAGIGKFKQKIRESQRKLDRTSQDLLRINDRVQEKDRYVRMLGRQVEKAKRYKRYHDDLKTLEVGFENRRFTTLDEAIKERRSSMAQLQASIETLRANIAAAESTIEKFDLHKAEKEEELQQASKNLSDASDKINASDREITVCRQSQAFLKENVARFEQESASIESQSEEKTRILGDIEKSIISRKTQLEECTHRVESAKDELSSFDSKVFRQREVVDDLTTNQLDLVHATGEKQRELSNCQTNLGNMIEQCERNEAEIKRLEERLEEYRLSLKRCHDELQVVNETFENQKKARESLWERIQHEDSRYHSLLEQEKSLESQIDASKSKLHFLEGLDASFEGYSSGVKALLTKNIPGTMGIVADLIEVEDPQMIKMAERALGSAIQTVVYKTDSDLKKAMAYLKEEKAGVARMISLETLQKLNVPSAAIVAESTLPLRIQIDTKEDYKKLADYLFNRILTCDNAETAIDLQTKIETDSLIVSEDGTICYANGTVIAGKKKKSQVGILQRKQEIEKLSVDIKLSEKELRTVIHDKEICIINRDEAKLALVEIDEKLNTGRQMQQEHETNIKHYEHETENINERIQSIVPDLSQNRSSIDEYKWKIKEHKVELEEMQAGKSDLEAQISNAKEHLSDMDTKRAQQADHLKNIELSKQGLANRVEQDLRSIDTLKKDLETLAQSRQQKVEDRNKALAETENLKGRLEVLQETIAKQTEQREALQEVFEKIREEYNALLNNIEKERLHIKDAQRDLESDSDKRHTLEVKQTRDEEQKRAIREKIFATYEIDLQSPSEDIPMIDEEDAAVSENIHILKERLRRVGEVNMGAIKEFEQESGELKEMIVQRDDLQTAVDDLEKAIKKLNREARTQFSETFKEVQTNFREMFTTLFEGGEATLELEENVDPLDAAIKINARPAGKKMRGVALLSGGERALTAISLLFALYLVKPSAYCILDELDAPLDDANINRFVKVLKKFAEKTQFIIITHNKHTMEAADLLYGVTQQESGVSVVASVKLEDTRQLQAA